jgi:hypothetical protein
MKTARVAPTVLAKHLGVSRQYVQKLADGGVIERLPDGRFDQDQSRLKYLQYLRNPQRRSARAEADAEYRQMKMLALRLKIEKDLGRLMEHDEHIEILDEVVGLFRSELSGLPARLTRDLSIRRAAEEEVFQLLTRLAEKFATMAAQAPNHDRDGGEPLNIEKAVLTGTGEPERQ